MNRNRKNCIHHLAKYDMFGRCTDPNALKTMCIGVNCGRYKETIKPQYDNDDYLYLKEAGHLNLSSEEKKNFPKKTIITEAFVLRYPNDTDLGAAVRKLFRE